MKYVTTYNDHRSVELARVDFRKTAGLTHEFWVDRANCAWKRYLKAIIPPKDK